ncbi:hypothetical protein WAX74_17475 [Psychrobacillus sp. FJAT-51614]|uniref:JAB domain-containing protein n=1 Tax=Psychrobacillus mangrovi TaxID=3117745 RepID=A0ABU8F8T3_9BACI
MKGILKKYNLLNIQKEVSRIQYELLILTEIRKVEVATGINLMSGLEELNRIYGEKARIRISEHLREMRNTSQEYLHIHTHPENSPPSPEDIKIFLQTKEIKFMIIFGLMNATYFMSKKDTFDISEEQIKKSLYDNMQTLEEAEKYSKKYNETKDIKYIEDLFERTWSVTCAEFGINFHIIKGGI